MDGGGKAAARQAQDAADEEKHRQARIQTGTSVIRHNFAKSFDPAYYANLEKLGYAAVKPGVQQQYDDAMRQLQAALTRNGLLGSTARGESEARLDKQNVIANQMVDDSVRGSINARKTDVANSEMAAIGQLQASGDPMSAAAQAASLTAANTAAPRWSPLGQVFTDATAGLATQADLERSGQNRYNAGVSNWGNNIRRYTQNIGG
jgi:hypothetical protein